ncbi:isochorismatase family cysteine hydrolase [Streptomyces sp. ODS28]|uniref:cysteine hydrolase family protein n=1 Tax=Streptomyces sp. ODS28 TaxID=3136688 RepID=UPI0031E70548
MSSTALLAMDLQQSMVSRIAGPSYMQRVAGALAAARAADIPVVHITVGFRAGHPEVHPNNKMFSAIPDDAFTDSDPMAAIHADAAPLPGEPVISKNRISAFAGNDLRQVLAAKGIDHLVLTGIATSGVVLSTLCEASDMDFRITVLEDACADPDPEVHRVLMGRPFAARAEVTTIDEWAKALETPAI